MRRLLTRLPRFLRELMTRHARRVYGSALFTWMSGEVSQIAFLEAGHPLHVGTALMALGAPLLPVAILITGFYYPLVALLAAATVSLLVPPLVSAIVVMMTLNRWRRREDLDELAMLPFGRDALRTMILLPVAIPIHWGNVLLAWSIFLGPILWILAGLSQGLAPHGAGGQLAGGILGSVTIFTVAVFTGPLAFLTYVIASSGVPVGWYLAMRFHGPNALALALFYGLRFVLQGAFWVGCMWLHSTIVDEGPRLPHLLLFLFYTWFCLKQTIELGYKSPRRWAREDTALLQAHGVDVMRSPGDFEEAAGHPSHLKTFFLILWPWPRGGFDAMFFEED